MREAGGRTAGAAAGHARLGREDGRRAMKVIFITQITQGADAKNLNHFQRVHHLSRTADFTILAVKGASFAAASPQTRMLRSAVPGKLGLILYGLWLAVAGRVRQYDIVLTDPSLVGALGFPFKLAGARRWVVDVWDIPGRYAQQGRWTIRVRQTVARAVLRTVYRYADLFVVSILPNFELAAFKLPAQKILRCKNAIWLDEMAKAPPAGGANSTILCMRSVYTHPMGLDVMADAFARIAEKLEGLTLVLIGHIPRPLEPQVATLSGRADVRRIDHVEHGELQSMIAAATVCVVPFQDVDDLRQTYPVKVLEYMALGKPIIASDIAGMSEMIDSGRTGLLFKAGDAVDLSEKIYTLCRDEALRRRLSENALQSAKAHDCRTKNATIEQALRKLAGLEEKNVELPAQQRYRK